MLATVLASILPQGTLESACINSVASDLDSLLLVSRIDC